MKKNKFNIGDKVYHITPESDQGVVLDARYSVRENGWSYVVAFGAERESLLYYEDELNQSKTFS